MRILIVVQAVLIALPLLAHPPKEMALEFNADSSLLTVEVIHSVKDAAKHYINKVVVELNGKKVVEQTFKRQVDDELQHVTYKLIDATEGDKITVTGYCNISGKKNAELVVAPVTLDKEKE